MKQIYFVNVFKTKVTVNKHLAIYKSEIKTN